MKLKKLFHARSSRLYVRNLIISWWDLLRCGWLRDAILNGEGTEGEEENRCW